MSSRVVQANLENNRPEQYLYYLTAVLTHDGNSASSGHYTGKKSQLI